jgi:benzil reductase ((S)-benzoin forming)
VGRMSILITGVSSGIGHALALHYLDEGEKVVGLSRRPPVDLLVHGGFAWRELDLGQLDAIPGVIGGLVRLGSHFELVVLNAGLLGRIQDLDTTSIADLHQIMDVNVWSNKVLLESLWRRDASIDQVVAISSGAAVKGHRGWGGYAVSKAALNMLMQVYAAEHSEVHFSALAPGLVDTAMQEYMRTLPDTEQYASVARLKAAQGTPSMPDAPTAAVRLAEVFPKLKEQASGSFHDVRDL